MVIGNLALIVKDQVGLAAFSAVAVSALALGNGAGRVLYGVLSDKLGRRAILISAFLFQAVLIYLLISLTPGSPAAAVPVLMIFVALIGANYGANLAVFPALTRDYYGTENYAMNYGIVNTAWGLGWVHALPAGRHHPSNDRHLQPGLPALHRHARRSRHPDVCAKIPAAQSIDHPRLCHPPAPKTAHPVAASRKIRDELPLPICQTTSIILRSVYCQTTPRPDRAGESGD